MHKVNIEPGKIHQGPGIQLAKSTKLKLTNVNFNSFKNASIFANDGTGININVDACNIRGTTGVFPPIHLPQPGANITINNSLFKKNNIPQGKAGAVYVASSQNVIITNSTFVKNRGGYHGGALHVSGGGKLTIADSVFTSNQAVKGGAMTLSYLEAGSIIKSSNITDNTATQSGGGIYSYNNYLTIGDDVIIKGNTAHNGDNGISCGARKPILSSTGFDDEMGAGCL